MHDIRIPFPDTERIIFAYNPLIEVIFEIKFADIKVSVETYEDFKKSLNEIFVQFDSSELMDLEFEVSASDQPIIKQNKRTVFSAFDEKKVWTLNITNESLSLSCTNYKAWEDYRIILQSGLSALERTFNVKLYSRLGLRYRNVIDKHKLELEEFNWCELISGQLSGILTDLDEPEDLFVENNNTFRLRISSDEDYVKVNYGFVYNKEKRRAYLIDGDFFHQKETEVNNDGIMERLGIYSDAAGRLFRWGIQEKLRDKLLDPSHS